MRTIRLPDPYPRGTPAQRPEWGSSAWAADSCLMEWSTLEREWLGDPPAARPAPRRTFRARRSWTARLAVPASLLLIAVLAWSLLA